MKRFLVLALVALSFNLSAKDYKVSSPNGQIAVTVSVDTQIKWSAAVNNQAIFTNNTMSLDLGTSVLGTNPKVVSAKNTSVKSTVQTVVAVKSKTIENTYNQLNLVFKPNYVVSFRVFDNGIAYRFETSQKENITVKNEEVGLNFAGDYCVLFPEEETVYSHYKRLYLDQQISSLKAGRFSSILSPA